MTRILLGFVVLLLSQVTAFQLQQKSAINWPYAVCGTGPWKMTSFTVSIQPSRNANLTFIAHGTVTDYVEFDHIDADTKLNGLPIHTEVIPYTEIYDTGDLLTLSYTTFIPDFSPSGTYLTALNFKNKAGAAAGCFTFQFKL